MNLPTITHFEKDSIRIIPFGGCGEFGMNITGYICDDRLYLVDAGISFPDPTKLGVESILPDLAPWINQFGGVYSYIITHGHEDHIGALPYLLDRWPSPVYTTPWTAALIRNKLERRRITPKYPIHEIKPGNSFKCEDFSVEFVPFNHSIPEACGLMIRQGKFNIFHTGDFKFDLTPVLEAPVDLKKLERLGKEGIHLLLADSTNAHVKGHCPSEQVVIEPMNEAFKSAGSAAVVVTTFSSNFWRIKTILDACVTHGRKAFILGAGLENCIRVATELGLYQPPPGLLIDSSIAGNTDRSKICVIATGSQGEWRSALMRMAQGEHKQFSILPGDLVVFSSRTIPGNERVIQTMMSLLERRGAKIYSVRNNPHIHVSGHGYREELSQLLKLLRPKFFVPVHGTFSHLTSHGQIPKEIGLSDAKTFLIENGDVIDSSLSEVAITDRIDIDHLFVDGDSYELINYQTLRERLRIGELGLVVVSGVIDEEDNVLISDLRVQIEGVPEPSKVGLEEFMALLKKAARKGFDRARSDRLKKKPDIEEQVRVEVRRELQNLINKKPVVICHLTWV